MRVAQAKAQIKSPGVDAIELRGDARPGPQNRFARMAQYLFAKS
jgi:hypothetical protein